MNQPQSLLKSIYKLFLLGRKENWKIILLCLLGAGTFWFFNSLNKDYTTRISHPVKFVYNEDSTIVIGELPSRVRIEVSSGGWNILRKSVGFDVDPVLIELSSPTETKFLTASSLLPIISDQITELSVNYVAIDTLFFDIRNIVSRDVVLELDTTGLTMAENHDMVTEPVLDPDTVKLYAPEEMIDTIDRFTIVFDEKQIDSNMEKEIDIALPYPRYNVVMPKKTNLSFQVRRFVDRSASVQVRLDDFPPALVSDSLKRYVQLNFMVREDSVEAINDSSFVVTADFNNFNYSDSSVIPRVIQKPSYVRDLFFENPQLLF